MKRLMAMILVLGLLLCGCGTEPVPTAPPTETIGQTEPTKPAQEPDDGPDLGLYEKDSQIELDTEGAIRKYPLEGTDYYAIATMGEGLLVFSGKEDTTLTYLSEGADPIRVTLEDISIYPACGSCQVGEDGLGYYDPNTGELVLLDGGLTETDRITMPEDMACAPVLSGDLERAYFFDTSYLRCMELDTGISRILWDCAGKSRQITDLHFGDQILECAIFDETSGEYRLISTQTGETRYLGEVTPYLLTDGDRYYAETCQGRTPQYLFGDRGEEPRCIVPADPGMVSIPLPDMQGTVFLSYLDEGCYFEFYDLEQGTRESAVTLDGLMYDDIEGDPMRDLIWFVATDLSDASQALYSWDTASSPTGDTQSYIVPYYTEDAPDTQGLSRVAEEARQLGEEYGVKILVYQEAVSHLPVGYTFDPEYMVQEYDHYLPILEDALSAYPEGFLKKLGKSSGNGRVTICLVRAAHGDNEMGALSQVDGIQFWDEGNTYLTVAMNERLMGSVYHEIFHVIDTYILTETLAFDFWDGLNPEGFRYDNDYIQNQYREDDRYLEEDTRAFIDMYSMSYAKEDRARIVEYAMQSGNQCYFTSPTMQQKLRTVCLGIREAFGLEDDQTAYRWEQYLDAPLYG